MRKTLLIAAAALASSVISSQAQVYSQNIVGYINVPLASGYTALANQLDFDGTGTNNTVATVFGTNLLSGTTIFGWDNATVSFNSAQWISSKGVFQWKGSTNLITAALNVGQGVVIESPASNNITLVGTVIQGTNITPLATGYNLVSAVAPIAGGLQTTLGYVPTVNDVVFVYNSTTQVYSNSQYISSKGVLKWSPAEPQVAVGQSLFIETTGAEYWTNTFTE